MDIVLGLSLIQGIYLMVINSICKEHININQFNVKLIEWINHNYYYNYILRIIKLP